MIDSIKVSYAISFSSSKLEKTNKQIYGFLISLYLIKPLVTVVDATCFGLTVIIKEC